MKRFLVGVFFFFVFPIHVLAGNPPDQSQSTITGTYVPADGLTSSSVTIVLRDSSGNTLSGSDAILLTSSDSTASFNPSATTLDGSGTIYIKMKASTVGYVPVTVRDTTTSTTITGSVYFYQPGGSPPSEGACLDPAPGSNVTLLSATPTSDSVVTLTWTLASNPVTYYLVSYGTTPGSYSYGNPNVGGQGTTSYAVGGLQKGKRYYFAVRAVNGCTSGAYSNERSAVAGLSGIATPTPSPTLRPLPTISPVVSRVISPTIPLATTIVLPTITPVPTIEETTVVLEESTPSPMIATLMIASSILGVCILLGVGIWVFVARKKQPPPPIIQ